MSDIDPNDLKKRFLQASALATGTITSGIELLGNPRRFHSVRKRRRSTRLNESIRFAVATSVLMIAMYFVTVSSEATINGATAFLTLGAFLNLAHLLAMAGIVGIVGRVVVPQVPLRVHIENVLYATAVLPIVALFAQPLMDAQLRAVLADSHLFTFGYRPSLAAIMDASPAASVCDIVVRAGYAWFAALVYFGLRVAADVSRWRAIAVVAPAMLGILLYQGLVILPSTQQFVHAMTR